MRNLFAAVLLGAASLTVPAFAGEPENGDAERAEKPKKEQKICKRVATEMGSRRKERVCLTSDEWRKVNNPN